MPTALDNGRRSPKKLLRAVVARLLGRKSLLATQALPIRLGANRSCATEAHGPGVSNAAVFASGSFFCCR